MLYSYGSFLSKITLSLLCIVVPVLYMAINPSRQKSYSSSFLIVGVTNFEGVGVTKMHNLQFYYVF